MHISCTNDEKVCIFTIKFEETLTFEYNLEYVLEDILFSTVPINTMLYNRIMMVMGAFVKSKIDEYLNKDIK